MARTRDLSKLQGDPRRAIRNIAIPLIVSFAVSKVNSYFDSFWTSGLGASSASAISTVAPFYWMMSAAGTGLGVGAASCIAFSLGKGDFGRASRLAGNSMLVGVIVSVLVSSAMFVFAGPLLEIIGAEDVMDESLQYLYPYIFMCPATIVHGVVSGMFRGEGASRKSMTVLIIAVAFNMVFDPLFIYGLDLGVAGAGWATVVSTLISTLIGLWWFTSGRMVVRLERSSFRPDRSCMKDVLTIGGPRTAESLITDVTDIIQRVFIIAAAGTTGVLLYNLPFRYIGLAHLPSRAISSATVSVTAFNYGRSDLEKMRIGLMYSATRAIAISSVLAVVLWVFADPLMQIFTYEESMAELRPKFVWVLRMVAIAIPFNAMKNFGSSVLQSLKLSYISTGVTTVLSFFKLGMFAAASTVSFDCIIYALMVYHFIGGVLFIVMAVYQFCKVGGRLSNAPVSDA